MKVADLFAKDQPAIARRGVHLDLRGQPPAGEIDACVRALADAGEAERFTACRDAMQHARQVAVLATRLVPLHEELTAIQSTHRA